MNKKQDQSNMRFPVSRVPGMSDKQIEVFVTEINPVTIQPTVSIQGEWNHSSGIIRGKKRDGLLLEDHIDEIIENGMLNKVNEPIVGPGEMRKQVWTIARHLEEQIRLHQDWHLHGSVGNGNGCCNPFFTTTVLGKLFRLDSELSHLSSRRYTSLVTWNKGQMPRVTIETLRFAEENGKCRVFSCDRDCEITDKIETSTFGQQIVTNGKPKSRDDFSDMVLAGQFYDFRHRFLFGRYALGRDSMGKDRWLDVGLAPLWQNNGEPDIDMLRRACAGDEIPVDITQFAKEGVEKALQDKGYLPTEYRFDGSVLHLKLRPGIYPHNMIGMRHDGTLISVAIRGLSNRVGVTLEQAAEIMALLGAENALILDNGNDVFVNFSGDFLIGSEEGLEKRLRSVLFFKSESTHQIAVDDIRLVIYPRQ